jgi:hypothetical protein
MNFQFLKTLINADQDTDLHGFLINVKEIGLIYLENSYIEIGKWYGNWKMEIGIASSLRSSQ